MAIQDKLWQTQSWLSTVGIKTTTEQYYQPQQLQLIPSQHSNTPQIRKSLQLQPQPLLPLPARPSEPLNATHACQVQWFACQLSKETMRQYLSVISVPLPLPKGSARFELLPQNVLDQICQYVPYENLLWLYQGSRTLNRIINPHLAPYETKLSFVLRAERDYSKHCNQKPPNLGCYMCHKVLSAGVFASNQPLQAIPRAPPSEQQLVVNLRRFCIYCGIRSGCHVPGDSLITRTGDQFWLCNCLHILSAQVSTCSDCRAMSPFSPRRSRYRAWGSRN
ncbi:hypothetical protein AAE478_009417 [Parahypoxylon ruwenzoriense]